MDRRRWIRRLKPERDNGGFPSELSMIALGSTSTPSSLALPRHRGCLTARKHSGVVDRRRPPIVRFLNFEQEPRQSGVAAPFCRAATRPQANLLCDDARLDDDCLHGSRSGNPTTTSGPVGLNWRTSGTLGQGNGKSLVFPCRCIAQAEPWFRWDRDPVLSGRRARSYVRTARWTKPDYPHL